MSKPLTPAADWMDPRTDLVEGFFMGLIVDIYQLSACEQDCRPQNIAFYMQM
jgi:hypothetical protein